MILINEEKLNEVTEAAKASPRLRMNYNYHESLDAPVQRMLNALEPGTDLPIHRHMHTDETYVLLRGKIVVTFHDDQKRETERVLLDPSQGSYGVNIPKGKWHTLKVLESGSVILEVKEGPYAPLGEEDVLK